MLKKILQNLIMLIFSLLLENKLQVVDTVVHTVDNVISQPHLNHNANPSPRGNERINENLDAESVANTTLR